MIFGLFGGAKKRNQQLRDAASEGQVDRVKELLAKGADPQEQDPESGETALNLASNGGFVGVVAALLLGGAPVDLRSRAGYTSLYIAAAKGDAGMAIVELLLGAGAGLELGPATGNDAGATALYVAASRGALQLSRRLLAAGASPALRVIDGSGLLHAAALSGNAEVVLLAAGLGVAVDAVRKDGLTPLHVAALTGQADAAAALVDLGAALEPVDGQGRTPLIAAALNNRVAAVKLLLARGAKPDAVVVTGSTELNALCGAAINGFDEVVKALTDGGALVDAKLRGQPAIIDLAKQAGHENTVAILMAARKRQRAAAKAALAPGREVAALWKKVAQAITQQDKEALRKHAESQDFTSLAPDQRLLVWAVLGDATQVQAALTEGANPDVVVQIGDTSLYPLLVAVMNDYDNLVRILLDKGANAAAKVEGAPSLVTVAKQKGHEASAKLISAAINKEKAAKKEASIAAKEADGLWQRVVQAISQKDQDGLRTLADGRAFASLSVDLRLLAACALGDAKIARDMLQAGADPNKPCREGFDGLTPLVMTVGLSRSVEIASLLIDAGANVNDEWFKDTTPIFETTADQFYDLAKLLIDHGANVNVRLGDGMTPLMFAVRNSASRCVDLFLGAGADINAVDEEHGVGAFGLALNQLDLQLAEHLLARGAEPNFGSIETLPLAVAEHGSLSLILAIEAGGGSIVPPDVRGRVAFVAARNKDGEVFDHVLSRGADINEGNDFNYTPLTLATLNNHETLVGRYLDRGDDPDALDIDKDSALSLAIEYERPGIVRLLQQHGAQQSIHQGLSGEESMLRAAEEGALGTVLDLRDAGVSINVQDAEGNSPLMLATKAGHHGVVRSLYHLGADINHRNLAGESATAIATALDRQDLQATMKEFVADDAVPESMRSMVIPLGGFYDIGNTMFGRLSHPGKSKPPYDNSGSDAEDESDEEDESDDDEDVDEADEVDEAGEGEEGEAKPIREKLRLLGRALASDSFKSQVSEQTQEHLDRKLNHWIELNDESNLGEVEIKELNRLLAGLGLGEKGEDAEEQETSPLFAAIQQKNIAAVKRLAKSGVDVEEPDGEGNTPLIAAVLSGEPKAVDALLKLSADANKARPDGITPLFAAVLSGNERSIQILISGGAEVEGRSSIKLNGTDVGGCTALFTAAITGRLAVVKTLLANRANLEAANDLGYTPLMAALEGGHDEIIDLLLKTGAKPDPALESRMTVKGLGGASPLNIATRKENLPAVRKLLKAGADVNRPAANSWTCLKTASQQGNLALVKVLLDAGADVDMADETNYTPLMNAVSGEHEAIVRLLLKQNANPNIQSADAPDIEEWEPGRTALMDAALSGNLSIARNLIKSGANPNLLNGSGRTALHSAVFSGNRKMVELLLEAGADVNVYGNTEGRQSALDLALRRRIEQDLEDDEAERSDILGLLLKKGFPEDRSSFTETFLDLMLSDHKEVIEILQKYGTTVDPDVLAKLHELLNSAEYNSPDEEQVDDEEPDDDPSSDNPTEASKSHALITAVNLGFPKLVEQALAAGADVNEVDAFGATALLTALFKFSDKMSRRHQRDTDQIIDLLLRRGADPDKGRVPPLWLAIRGGRVHLVNAMIKAGVSLDQVIDIPRVDEPGSMQRVNALFLAIGVAASEGPAMDERMAVSLVRAGIDLSVVSDGGLALHQTSSNGMAETLQAILEREPAMVDALDDAGATALMLAATNNRPRSVAALLAGGADRTIKDPSGMTAADHAAGHSDLMEQLA